MLPGDLHQIFEELSADFTAAHRRVNVKIVDFEVPLPRRYHRKPIANANAACGKSYDLPIDLGDTQKWADAMTRILLKAETPPSD